MLNEEGRILIIKRAANDSYHPNCWECPGGKLDQGQDLAQAREREVLEETGLLITLTQPLLYVDSYIVGPESKYAGMAYVELFGVGRPTGGEFALSFEHSDFAWVTYEEALSYELTPEVRKAMIVLKSYLSLI